MKIKNKMLTSMLFGLAAGLLLAAVPARALTPVTACGQTLDVPGGAYILTVDLDCSGTLANGVNITASNVVFHLAGHTISSTDCDVTKGIQGIFVSLAISGVRIDGGTVRGFNDGIGLNSSNSRVNAMTVTNACFFGIALQNQNNQVDTSVVTLSGLDGIALQVATGTIIAANDISGNLRLGVDISNNSNNNFVKSNIINGNGTSGEQGGVGIFFGTNNVVANNALNHNFNGIEIESPGNFALTNKVNGSSSTGIFITTLGTPSTVKQNTVLGSVITDMNDTNASCDMDIWRKNTFQTDLVAGASDGGPGTGCIR
jgi:hypothetical protein